MLRNVLFLLSIPVMVFAIQSSNRCSNGCNCTETAAVCDTLYLKPFGYNVLTLKISHPKVPLILKRQVFKIPGLENVNSITIENATILTIDNSAFEGVPLLSTINIVNSNVPSITNPLAFASANALRILKISNSTLKTFEFLKTHSLEELNLSGCRLTAISENAFADLPSLTSINLENNRISTIDPKALFRLYYLEEIVLSNNNVSYLDPKLFQNNKELISLTLSNNPLERIDVKIVSDLEKLVLKSNRLDYLSEQLRKKLYLLNDLDLSDNKLNVTNDYFKYMEDLQYLDLSNNGLKHLDSHVFKENRNLHKLILDDNDFRMLPKFVPRDGQFEAFYFSCKRCGLFVFQPDTFKHFPAIVTLQLSHNSLNGLNLTEIHHLRGLIALDLSYNNISNINPSSFMKSTALERLNLAGNPIIQVDSAIFANNKALKVLDLSFCKLNNLWSNPIKRNVPSIRLLDVANNSIFSISVQELKVTPSLKVLDISNNPLRCDETFKEFITWLGKHDVSPVRTLSTWKSHEDVKITNTAKYQYVDNSLSTWKMVAKTICEEELHFESLEEVEIKLFPKSTTVPSKHNADDLHSEYDEYDYLYDDSDESDDTRGETFYYGVSVPQDTDIDIADLSYGSLQFKKQQYTSYPIWWSTLIFVFTALSVLAITVIVMLLMIRLKKIPRHIDLPRVKIPQWNTTGKLKKHSGSVYQPLSEEKLDTYHVLITGKEHVHN